MLQLGSLTETLSHSALDCLNLICPKKSKNCYISTTRFAALLADPTLRCDPRIDGEQEA